MYTTVYNCIAFDVIRNIQVNCFYCHWCTETNGRGKKDFSFLFLFCLGFSEDQFKYLKNPQELLQNVSLSDIIPHDDHTLLKLCNLLHYSQISLKHI